MTDTYAARFRINHGGSDGKSYTTNREIFMDCSSWAEALKMAMSWSKGRSECSETTNVYMVALELCEADTEGS